MRDGQPIERIGQKGKEIYFEKDRKTKMTIGGKKGNSFASILLNNWIN